MSNCALISFMLFCLCVRPLPRAVQGGHRGRLHPPELLWRPPELGLAHPHECISGEILHPLTEAQNKGEGRFQDFSQGVARFPLRCAQGGAKPNSGGRQRSSGGCSQTAAPPLKPPLVGGVGIDKITSKKQYII